MFWYWGLLDTKIGLFGKQLGILVWFIMEVWGIYILDLPARELYKKDVDYVI